MTSTMMTSSPAGRPLGAGAIALVVMLCLSWGFNQIAVKVAMPDVPPLIQATIRSFGALLVVLLAARIRGVKMFERDGTLKAGLICGVLFGIEFVLIYRGLLFTSASRAVLFLYVAPFVVALGSWLLGNERLSRVQWLGLGLSFVGLSLAFGLPQPSVDTKTLIGDAMLMLGGVIWAVTTLMLKSTRLLHAPAEKSLSYQLAVSVLILGAASLMLGETVTGWPRTISLISLAYQSFWVVGITFLIWVAMVKSYSANRLSAFTFLTPLFGVIGGYVIMNDPITPAFIVAAVLVIAGLILVNRPPAKPNEALRGVTKT
ncbi:MAG: multidrug DMT transporter permease [Proteobacteria bacterium SG_bin9]|nr:MAG: multidrug DMT transporter permease [Proteobacteria bacterium SG_bin9]